KPDVLLCDELSLGLAAVVINDIDAAFAKLKASGAAIIIVELDIVQALKVADRIYCMLEGRITLTGRPSELDRAYLNAA
ncbi:ABC transporter ATP-binding protein, partial [Rhizobium ruizarguesonis]